MQEYQYKILVVGDLGTGKTSILRRFVHNTFTSHYKSTIGVDFALKVIQLKSNLIINLQLWDIAGQERFGSITRAYYKGAVGAFVVYDVTRPATFENVLKWKRDIDDKIKLPGGEDIPAMLLANKIDQSTNPKNRVEMDQFCKENGFIQWYETSAKLDKCITEAAKHLIDTILELEVLKSCGEEYEIDYTSSAGSSIITLHDQSHQDNKIDSSSRCCS